MQQPSVYAIILNWNHLDDLRVTLEAFRKQDYPGLHIVVADNGSTDGSLDYLRTCSDITLLENGANLGWAEGNNIGIKYALECNADYILLSNNDIDIPASDLISALVKRIEELKPVNAQVISTRVNYFDPPDKEHNRGGFFFASADKQRPFNRFRSENHSELPPGVTFADFAAGCFMMVSSSLFRQIGSIDNAFFMYGEESDFCLRAWESGSATVIDESLMIHHKVGASSVAGSPFTVYYKTRNMFYLLNKHRDHVPDWRYFRKLHLISAFKKLFKITFRPGQFKGRQLDLLRALGRAIFDGLIAKKTGRIF